MEDKYQEAAKAIYRYLYEGSGGGTYVESDPFHFSSVCVDGHIDLVQIAKVAAKAFGLTTAHVDGI